MRLAGIEYQNRNPPQGDSKSQRRKMSVVPLVLAQEEIAECHTAILLSVMVIPGAATSHESHEA